MTVSGYIEKYGERIKIGENEYYAVIYPIENERKKYIRGTETYAGTADESVYGIIATHDADLRNTPYGTIINAGDESYVLCKGENFRLFGKILYSYGYLRRGDHTE